jgi:hypothetical protein
MPLISFKDVKNVGELKALVAEQLHDLPDETPIIIMHDNDEDVPTFSVRSAYNSGDRIVEIT